MSFGLVTHHITTINIVTGKRWVYQSCIAEETRAKRFQRWSGRKNCVKKTTSLFSYVFDPAKICVSVFNLDSLMYSTTLIVIIKAHGYFVLHAVCPACRAVWFFF